MLGLRARMQIDFGFFQANQSPRFGGPQSDEYWKNLRYAESNICYVVRAGFDYPNKQFNGRVIDLVRENVQR